MKIFKQVAIITGILIILAGLFLGSRIAMERYASYQDVKSLDGTALGMELSPGEVDKGKALEEGEILTKRLIELSEIEPLWEKIADNNSLKDEFRYLDDIEFYSITYKSDSLLVNGLIAQPKAEGEFPVIIFNRGGNKHTGNAGKLKTLLSLVYSASGLAKEGYVILASCYRENDEFGGKDINDVLNLVRTAEGLKKADPSRIGMLGVSRGGMMTYLSLQRSDRIKTAAVVNGPTDLSGIMRDRPEMETGVYAKLIPNYEENKEEELEKRSVIYWADEMDKNASLLILCGMQDRRVNPDQGRALAEKLDEINYDFSLKELDGDHKFSGKTRELNAMLVNWFKEKL